MFNQWQSKFIGRMDDLVTAKECVSEFKELLSGKKIVFWGANSHGKTMLRLFKDIGLNVSFFVDKNWETIQNLGGIPVQTINSLHGLDNETAVIATVNKKNFEAIVNDANQLGFNIPVYNGFDIHLPLQSSFCLIQSQNNKLLVQNCSSCTQLNHTCKILSDNIRKHKGNIPKKDTGANITLIGCILGTICTLSCEHCVEHVPYISQNNKRFYDKHSIINDIQKLADACNFITVVDFVGGEPFSHPELAEIIEAVHKIDNIGIINIFTNGTVMPSEELLRQLRKDYVNVNLSDYSANLTEVQRKKIENTKETLINNNVLFFEAKNFTWFDTRSFDYVDDDNEKLAMRFNNCILKDCYRLADGKLFRCLHHYAGYVTGNLKQDASVVDTREEKTREQLVDEINNFFNLPYIEACKNCKLPYETTTVSSGIQFSKR